MGTKERDGHKLESCRHSYTPFG